MPGRSTSRPILAAAVVLGIVSACTGGTPKPPATTTATTKLVPSINMGGDISVAAEGEPGCMDWISNCAGSAWGIWTVQTNTMPRAYDFTRDNLYKPSILLAGEAEVQRSSGQVVTYRLNPRAVWSDGQPITSHDFKYTWDQVAHDQDIHDQSGYRNIVSVDDSDPRTAVVTFSQPFADWRKLFGGPDGVLPSHLLEGHDRHALMKDGYAWSGGPWELAPDGWARGQSIKLVPNLNFWGKKPDLSSVTFRIFTDPAAELQAYASGQVLAAYPAPEPAAAAFRALPSTLVSVTGGLDYEALWFDVRRDPLAAKALRQAVAYSLDRSALAAQTVGALVPGAVPIQSLLTPAYDPFYTEPFAKYRPDPLAAKQLMVGAGWAMGKDGLWAKAGQKATIDLKVSTQSARDQEVAKLAQAQLQSAGFVLTLDPEAPGSLLARDLPAGVFAAALFPFDIRRQLASGVPPGTGIDDNDPGQCPMFCSANIPAPANSKLGTNYVRVSDPNLDRYLADLDTNLSDSARLSDATQAATILADLVPAVPLAALPDVVVVNTAKLAVEGGTFSHNLAYGPYGFLNEWYLK